MTKFLINKINYILLVYLFWGGTGNLMAQQVDQLRNLEEKVRLNKDSMNLIAEARLKNTTDSPITLKDAYFIKGFSAFLEFDYDTLDFYFDKAIKLAEVENDFKFAKKVHYRQGIADDRRGKFEDAAFHFRKMDSLAKITQDQRTRIYALNALGNIENSKERYVHSEDYFREALTIPKIDSIPPLKWSILYGLISSLKFQMRFTEGFDVAYQGLKIAESLNDSMSVAKTNMVIGVLKLESGEPSESNAFLMKARKYFLKENAYYWIALCDYNISLNYLTLKESDQSLKYSLSALYYNKIVKDKSKTILSYANIGKSYNLLKEYKKAILYADSCLALNQGTDLIQADIEGKLISAISYSKLGNNSKSLSYLNDIDPKGREVGNSILYVIAETHSEVYEQLGNHKKALFYAKKTTELAHQKKVINHTRAITAIESKYKFDKQEAENRRQQDLLMLEKKQELQARENIIKIGIVFVILIFILLFLLYRLYKINKRDKNLLEVSNEEITLQSNQLKEIDQLKSRFFTNISHEFRTPLTLIKGPVEQLLKKEGDKGNNTSLQSIAKNTNRLMNLINQILELSELQSRHRVLKLSETELDFFIGRIVGSFESLAELRNIYVKFTINPPKQKVYIEKESIEKVLVNLLSNAFKFTQDEGAISIHVMYEEGKLNIVVKDTGVGIEKNMLKNIFEMFYYTESERSASSGIGLALTRELVKNHQGTIEVKSELNKGAIFTIEIPVELKYFDDHQIKYELVQDNDTDKNEDSTDDIAVNEFKNPFPDTSKESILLVEDNDEIRAFTSSLLSDFYHVIEAVDGEEGIEKALKFIPDLILSDVMMPIQNGFDLAKRLKEDEKTSHIPIILLTAKGDKKSRMEGLSLQIDDYLTKPFDQDELMVRIENLIKTRKNLQDKFGQSLISDTEELELPTIDEQFIERVKTVIEDRIDDQSLSVDELAKEVGVSRSQMHRKIVALSGKSTSVFIRNIRLKKAHSLLLTNSYTIAEISDQVGFSSPSYFNKCFKELYGVTPKQAVN